MKKLILIVALSMLPFLAMASNRVEVGSIERQDVRLIEVQTDGSGDALFSIHGNRFIRIEKRVLGHLDRVLSKTIELMDASNSMSVTYRRSLGALILSRSGERMTFVFSLNSPNAIDTATLSGRIHGRPDGTNLNYTLTRAEVAQFRALIRQVEEQANEISEQIQELNELLSGWRIY